MLAYIQLIGIVLFNAIPLAGVLWFDWHVFEVILLYWFENVAIGVAHFVRMRIAERASPPPGGTSQANFFAMHYGMFTFVHGIFVIAIFGVVMLGLSDYRGGLGMPLLALVFWQFVSLASDYALTDGFKGQKSEDMLFQPYPRVLALHVTIIAGGWFIAEMGNPVWAVALLVTLKTIGDLGFQMFQFQGVPGNVVVSLRKTRDDRQQ
jgi:hypothetical protein